MKPVREVGIVGYGAYVPRYRLPASKVADVWKDGNEALPVTEKAVAGPDEDTLTIALEAGRNALRRARIDPARIGAVWVGSESHPYAVKPTSTIVADAIGAAPELLAADWEFACKGGSETMQAGFGLVGSGMAHYVLSIGADTAQGRPGDDLEYTAACGGAAYIIGPRDESLAYLEASYSYVTDTPDFYRKAEERYPLHQDRYTGEPAYFHHVLSAAGALLEQLGAKPSDYRMATFHQPNVKFPQRAGKLLGFAPAQLETGLLSDRIGNTYAGAALLGFTAMLDKAQPGDRLLLVSYGSGAGSDAMSFVVTDSIEASRDLAASTLQYVERRKEIDYAHYLRYRGNIRMR